MRRKIILRTFALLTLTLVFVLLAAASSAQSDPPATAEPPSAPALQPSDAFTFNAQGFGVGNKPQIATLSSDLDSLLQAFNTSQAAGLAQADALNFEVANGTVAVMFIMHDNASADAAIPVIEASGGIVTARYDRWIDALVPIPALGSLARLPGLSLLRRVIEVYPVDGPVEPSPRSRIEEALNIGTYTTEGVAASNASAWHTEGITGNGIIVAVLDSFQSYTSAITAGELPPANRISTLGTLNSGSPHGTAVAEIVYDMAPGVNLILVSPSSATQMAQRIVELANYPVATRPHIITSSMGFYNAEPGDGSGVVSQAIDYAASQGVLYTQAAGNQALGNWQGNFSDSDSDDFHNFSGVGEVNLLNYGNPIPAGYPILLFMRWNAWPTTNQDYDLYLYDCTSTCTLVTGSTNVQDGTQPPVEAIQIYAPNTGVFGYAVALWSGTGNAVIDVMGHNLPGTSFSSPDRSLVDPATGTGAFGVAALYRSSPFPLESYSSRGPALGPGGTLGSGNAQPRASGFAVVDTWAYGPDDFNGTSSATPHVAGAAALVMEAYPEYSLSQVRTFLESRAVDMGTTGYDYTYGAGRLWLGDPPASISGNVLLQGRPTPPHSTYSVSVHVVVTPSGGGAAVYDGNVTTDDSGNFTISGLTPGSYTIWVKHANTLANSTTTTLSGGANVVNLGTLRAGDADDSNVVNLIDFSVLASTFAKSSGQTGYDARADFNGDAIVNLLDFSMLAANFAQAGA